MLPRLIDRILHAESASSIALLATTLLALFFANSPAAGLYAQVLGHHVLGLTVEHWINDGLMTIFFFVVGMEIKRELVSGELSSWRKAALPVCAALGGMIVPAALYLGLNAATIHARGWAIPMATDIAFALGVLTLLGKRVPHALKIFLLALAIADDLGAVLVIALVYTQELNINGLYVALSTIAAIVASRFLGVRSLIFYVPMGILLWAGVLYSGVHATIAGVILGFLTPAALSGGREPVSPLNELIDRLHPWVAFGIMPIFALANAGVSFAGISGVLESKVAAGIALGLVLGKPLGITLACAIATLTKLATLPTGVRKAHIFGVACLAGIGFTMAIFVTNLSLDPAQINSAKMAILLASCFSAVLGFAVLAGTLKAR